MCFIVLLYIGNCQFPAVSCTSSIPELDRNPSTLRAPWGGWGLESTPWRRSNGRTGVHPQWSPRVSILSRGLVTCPHFETTPFVLRWYVTKLQRYFQSWSCLLVMFFTILPCMTLNQQTFIWMMPLRPMIYHGYVWLHVAGCCCWGHRPHAHGIGWREPEVVWSCFAARILGFDRIVMDCPSNTGIEAHHCGFTVNDTYADLPTVIWDLACTDLFLLILIEISIRTDSKSNNITIDGWKGESSEKSFISDLGAVGLCPDVFG